MKNSLLLYYLLSIIVFSCNNSNKELELKEKELELKERELKLLETEKEGTNKNLNSEISSFPKIEMLEPEEQVLAFLNEIGMNEYKKAFQRQNNKYWKPYEKFISTSQGYGGTSDVEIYDSHLVEETDNYAKVFVNYFAADPYNM